jgi:Cof subfamily protein (haloacid dehalogenase superfamily)
MACSAEDFMKLFVTDIDDTLSVGETVSEEVRAACRRLRDGGWDVMIATGRAFGAAKRHMEAASASLPSILYDGARIMDAKGRELYAASFDLPLAQEILDALWSMPVEIQLAGDELVYCRESDAETISFYRQSRVPVHYVTSPDAQCPLYRIGFWGEPRNILAAERRARELFGGRAEVVRGGEQFLDILPAGVSKGSALERFVSGLPRRPEVIVAAGDQDNDRTMLRYADVSAAPRGTRAASFADVIMPTVAEHGVRALADYLLSPDFPRRPRRR